MEEALQDQQTPTVDRREKRGFILGSMSVGHGISHLYDLGLPLIIQEIASTSAMNLGGFQVAGLFALRQASSGIINLGGGPIIDTFKSHWGIILTGCMIWSAIAYAAIGASPNYTVPYSGYIAGVNTGHSLAPPGCGGFVPALPRPPGLCHVHPRLGG